MRSKTKRARCTMSYKKKPYSNIDIVSVFQIQRNSHRIVFFLLKKGSHTHVR